MEGDGWNVEFSICLSIHPSIHPSLSLSIYPSIDRSIDLSIYRFIDLSIYRSVCLSIYLSIDLSIYLPIDLPIYLPIDLSIYLSSYRSSDLSIYRSIYLSTYLSIFLSFCLSIYLSIQPKRRTLFRHLNFEKCSETVSFLTLLTSKRASRHNGVHFFDVSTSKSALRPSVFYTFEFGRRFAPQPIGSLAESTLARAEMSPFEICTL